MGPRCQPHKTRSVWFLPLFLPLISRYSTLTPHLCRPVNAEGRYMQMGPGCQPHKREAYDCFHYFYPWFLVTRLLTFDHFPLVNVERRCWQMGPECQPHNTRNSWYVDYFLPMILHLPDFIFDPVCQTTLLADGSPRSASQYKKTYKKYKN